jgi:hypothetical protein
MAFARKQGKGRSGQNVARPLSFCQMGYISTQTEAHDNIFLGDGNLLCHMSSQTSINEAGTHLSCGFASNPFFPLSSSTRHTPLQEDFTMLSSNRDCASGSFESKFSIPSAPALRRSFKRQNISRNGGGGHRAVRQRGRGRSLAQRRTTFLSNRKPPERTKRRHQGAKEAIQACPG